MQTKNIEYQDGEKKLEGYLAYDEKLPEKRPAILIAHDWSGRNEFACKKAEQLSELGYVGFALDMFGKGIIGKNNDEKTKLMQPLIDDRALLRKRIVAGFDIVKKLEMVDSSRIGAIGFCFGGLCALDLARSGADVKAVVSFHGIFIAPQNVHKETIKAKILAFHGYDDPMVPAEQVTEFEKEMSAAKVDWQIHIFANTMHGFTNPQANDPKFGTVYNPSSDKRSWVGMKNFFAETFEEELYTS
jgi:dienelactone hydrolase